MAESDFPHPYVIGYGSSPSRCEPGLFVATGQAWDLPVPAQRACAHARFFDHAGPSGHSRCRARTYCLPPSQRRRRPGYESLRGSMAGLCTPLPTLRRRPYGLRRTAWGRYGSLLLHRIGLAPTARCRSPGALRTIPELVTLSKAKPGTLSYGTFSFPLAHFMEKLKQETGADIVRIPFRSGNEVVNAVLSGSTPVAILALSNMVPQLQSGHITAL